MVQSPREVIRANRQQAWLKTNLADIVGMMQATGIPRSSPS